MKSSAPLLVLATILITACAALLTVSPYCCAARALGTHLIDTVVADEDEDKKEPGSWKLVDAGKASATVVNGTMVVSAEARLPTVCHEAVIVRDVDSAKPNSYKLLGRQVPKPGEFCPRPRHPYVARAEFEDRGYHSIYLLTAAGVRTIQVRRNSPSQ
jgi:hypothetical protein